MVILDTNIVSIWAPPFDRSRYLVRVLERGFFFRKREEDNAL
jgi:hypothetical protein